MKKRISILPAGLTKKLCSSVVAAAMTLSLVGAPNVAVKAADTQTVEGRIAGEAISLNKPRIVKDDTYESGQRVTYDCVYFGSYPQAEVVASESDETTVNEAIRNGNDYVVNSALYAKLKAATGWDANGDVTIGGEKYRRIKSTDATYYSYSSSQWVRENFFCWGSAESKGYDENGYVTGDIYSETYHYFKYQPIKWRVLSVDGGTAFLLADEVIDCQRYNTKWESVTWETSTIRSFLNSYSSSSNHENIDYSGKGFLDTAFTAAEKLAIKQSAVVNDDNKYYGTEAGNDTTDRIFLLSENETHGDVSTAYGFVNDYSIYDYSTHGEGYYSTCDEARRAKSSTYAKAMGCYSETYVDKDSSTSYAGNCEWWVRSSGFRTSNAEYIGVHGRNSLGGSNVDFDCIDYIMAGVRPALKFNLSYSNLFGDAGTYTTSRTSHVHSYTWTVTKKATCASEGVKRRTCSCGEVAEERIAKDSSNHENIVTDKAVAATCTKTGRTAGSHCSACGKTIVKQNVVAKTAHKVVTDKAVAANCTKTGLAAGSHCSVCGTVIKAQKTVAQKAHTKSGWKTTKKATAKADGQKTIKCTKCGKTIKTAKIAKISSVKLSKTKHTYNGKAKKPTVTVKNSAGKTISASNYTVTYKNNKLPGKATVTFKGSYSGKVTKTFTINGLKQTITTAKIKTYKASSLKKKAVTVKLKAKTTGNGRLTYKVSKYPKNAKKYISVSKKGVVTLKKGAKKGIYKITITAAKTAKYAKATKTVTIKVK